MPTVSTRPFTVIRRSPFILDFKYYLVYKGHQRAIEERWKALGGSPGKAVSGLEDAGLGHRIRYEHGAIYAGGDTGAVWTAWVYGAIGERYDAIGGANSWLGLPVTDESPFAEGGRVSVFEHGAIYWWPDVGAVELNDVVVHYTGLVCFGETDWDQGSDSDEPYVILGAVSPRSAVPGSGMGESATVKTAVYGDVDAGESHPDLIEFYRGKPYGLSISGLLMEHDDGDPDKYKAAMQSAVGAAATGVTAGLAFIPVVGPTIAAVAGPLLTAVAPTVAEELNDLLDTADDRLGQWTQIISAKQMVVLAARTGNSWENGVGYKVTSPLVSGDGSSYKVYFGLTTA